MEEARLRFSKRLRELRTRRGLTQQQLAERADLDYKHIQLLEGRHPSAPRLDTLEKLAKALGITITKLLQP